MNVEAAVTAVTECYGRAVVALLPLQGIHTWRCAARRARQPSQMCASHDMQSAGGGVRCVRGMNASARAQRLPRFFEARESGAAASLANSCASARGQVHCSSERRENGKKKGRDQERKV